MGYRLGIDIGGTFTDFALVDDETGELAIHKQLTTPADPSLAVLSATVQNLRRLARTIWPPPEPAANPATT